jgi:DNA-binding transcriptional LysR family regulator
MLCRDLRYFVVLAEDPDLVRAALALGISRETLKAAVKRLEFAFEGRLVSRTRGGVTLTPAGHEMLFYAHRMLSLHAEAVRAVRLADERAP